MTALRDDLKAIVAQSGHDLANKTLTWGRDAGDTSVLDPDTGLVYILPKPSPTLPIPDWTVITPDDVSVVDLDGNLAEGSPTDPTVELQTHLHIYRSRSDVRAIVHTHGQWTRVFAALRRSLPVYMLEEFKYSGAAELRCATLGPAGSEVVAKSIVECLGEHAKIALLASHGAVAVGADMVEAMSVAEMAEDMARLAIYANMMGDPPELSLSDFIDEQTARGYLARRAL
jgi:L-fuculose-phosphate aldolase